MLVLVINHILSLLDSNVLDIVSWIAGIIINISIILF